MPPDIQPYDPSPQLSQQPIGDSVAGRSIEYEYEAVTNKAFRSPKQGMLTLYSDGQMEFVRPYFSKDNATFKLTDIKLANFGYGKGASCTFTLYDGRKYVYIFPYPEKDDELDSDIPGAEQVGLSEVKVDVGVASAVPGILTSKYGDLEWQAVLTRHLSPEKIKIMSTKEFLLWVFGGVFVVMAIVVIGTQISLMFSGPMAP